MDLASIYGAILALSADPKVIRAEMATKTELASLRREVAVLRADVAAYHGSVMGHGVLISELDERLRRVEQHVGLSPSA